MVEGRHGSPNANDGDQFFDRNNEQESISPLVDQLRLALARRPQYLGFLDQIDGILGKLTDRMTQRGAFEQVSVGAGKLLDTARRTVDQVRTISSAMSAPSAERQQGRPVESPPVMQRHVVNRLQEAAQQKEGRKTAYRRAGFLYTDPEGMLQNPAIRLSEFEFYSLRQMGFSLHIDKKRNMFVKGVADDAGVIRPAPFDPDEAYILTTVIALQREKTSTVPTI